MPGKKSVPQPRKKHTTKGGLVREVAYLYEDEEGALEARAERERCSKSEIIRRALREYLGIEG
ncbi:MAG TPA: CopG family transcriptional regulator [Thermoanaerobaculia bacterium]|nr:CopG family transcriptional regulator [Thermoanaerobaculia bacterium]